MQANEFMARLEFQESPLSCLTDFLQNENRFEQAQQTDKMRFVGYVLDLGYDAATIITSDPFKVAVGGIPRGSFLILAPEDLSGLPPHFTLLRVMETAPTPLSGQVQQTYFELHKKSMPELDIWTQSELQWGALKCLVLGMFYPDLNDGTKIRFSGDVNSVVSAHRYRVYSPDAALLDIIVNGLVNPDKGSPVPIGRLRPTENELAAMLSIIPDSETEVRVSVDDFKGARTAMFGKTRLGKSNVVKLLVQAIIDATSNDMSVGQLIFDINGEYANDNDVHGGGSIRSANSSVCEVYALKPRKATPSKPLRLNFYEQPDSGLAILASLLEQDGKNSNYIKSFANVELASVEETGAMEDFGDKRRSLRRIQMFWCVLNMAGFSSDESRLRNLRSILGFTSLNPQFQKGLRALAIPNPSGGTEEPKAPSTLNELTAEFKHISKYVAENPDDKLCKDLFQPDDLAILGFLFPEGSNRTGPGVLRSYLSYHHPAANDFVKEIISSLDGGKTVILDLGNANDRIRAYFADLLSRNVFSHQEARFTENLLADHFVQLYFEEAHNLFPASAKDVTGVYARFAKEGAKFHIGMTYSTQSPSTIYGELLAQTENFFVGHLSSSDETRALGRLQRAFVGVEEEIMRSRTPGYMRMLTQSHRFVIPVQANLYSAMRSV